MPREAVTWRLSVARRAAAVYAANPKVAAVVAAGSVGAGAADDWSDLELDLYWHEAPTDDDRTSPIAALGGDVERYWAYSAEEEEWGEEYRLGGLGVGVSSFLTATAAQFIHRVTVEGDPSTNAQMRVAAIQSGTPLHGEEVVAAWKRGAASYPDELRARMVRRYLAPDRIEGWHLRDALVHRMDLLALHDLLVRGQRCVIGALHGLNRVYLANPRMKWEQEVLERFAISPAGLRDRAKHLWRGPPANRVSIAESLITETVALAEEHLAIDLSAMKDALAQRRPRLTPPPAASG